MKDIEGFEGRYAVSQDGGVYSYKIKRFMKPWKDGSGHLTVTLGRGVKRKVHRLVALTYIPNPENHPLVLHGELGKEDNSVNNLRWGTHSDNLNDAYLFGEQPPSRVRGSTHGNSQLSDEDVEKIYILSHTSKMKQVDIGALFGVSYAQVSNIKRKIQWSHITDLIDLENKV